MKKKIGIITIVNVNNYGAELQAFALQEKLNKFGFNAEILNYVYYKNIDHIKTKSSQSFVQLSLKQQLKELLFPLIASLKSLPYKKQKEKREKKFSDFHKNFSRISKPYKSFNLLYKEKNFDYNVFLVGSDQVWNPQSNTNIEPYFLTFAPENAKKISYASSFGVDSIPKEYYSTYKKYLNNLDQIAVREKDGVRIVKEITGREIDWVLDPTFLLNKVEWKKFSTVTELKERYLLLYVLTDSDYITQLAYKIAKVLSLKIVRLCKNASKRRQR